MAVKRLAEVRAKPVRLVAGLMTGTSMDGLDVAVCRVERDAPWRFDLVASASEPMPGDLRAALAKGGALTVVEAAHLGRRLGEWYAAATDGLTRAEGLDLDLVGMHGQTVYHEHGRVTVQLGESSHVAERLGCPVISDFRQGDIAAGGCGAPLVPVVDRWLLGRADATVMAVNIGGIANLTLIPPDAARGAGVIGFDCGPGNMVLDELARRFTKGAAEFGSGWRPGSPGQRA